MQIKVQTLSGRSVIKLHGQFVFSATRDFRQAGNACLDDPQVHEVEFNMGGVEYLDSFALGSLLLLKERADATGKRVVISNCRGTVQKVLALANFGQIFNIAPALDAA